MGEWSKSIGEKGEKISKFLFEDILNFNSLEENTSINCVKGKKHKRVEAKKERTTHGLDGLINYKSPVEDYLLDIGLISSKYTGKEYPSSKSTLKTEFKKYIKDLAYGIECFRFSEKKSKIDKEYINVSKTTITGVLVWLSDASPLNYDLSPFLKNAIIDSDLNFDKIILVDNQKINFFYESIFKTKDKYKHENVDFVYHNSGINTELIQEKSYGKTFPLDYLYSDIIPLRIKDNNQIILKVFINDDFDEKSFAQVLNFTKSFDLLNAVDETIFKFKNYNSSIDGNLVKEKLSKFENYKFNENLFVEKFPSDFRN